MVIRQANNTFKLLIVSFSILFLEILLIRWVTSEIRIFAYLNNMVLLACFLGSGVGCFFSKKKINPLFSLAGVLLLIILINSQFSIQVGAGRIHIFKHITFMLGHFEDSPIWYDSLNYFFRYLSPQLRLVLTSLGIFFTLLLFIIVVFCFVPLGRLLAELFDSHRNIIFAYSINILGSLLGIWMFSLLSFKYTPPWVWFLLFAVSLVFLIPLTSKNLSIWIMLVMGIFLFAPEHTTAERQVLWSPYQKLDIAPWVDKGINRGYILNVNNVGYMTLEDRSDELFAKYSQYPAVEERGLSKYDIPFLKKNAQSVLIVGAGAGNDAAGAVKAAIGQIDAVEIDPGVYKLGLQFHPEKPYLNKNVNVIIDDARSFFKKSHQRYDIVSFGFLDSHTLSSNYNNMRLDNYVYTQESIKEARKLLSPGGVLALSFWVQREWLGQRLYGLLKETFGASPIVFFVGKDEFKAHSYGPRMFLVSDNMQQLEESIKSSTHLQEFIEKNRIHYEDTKVKLTSDDWPYLYLEKTKVPSLHLWVIIILLALFALSESILIPRKEKLNLHFFFLGAAFMLIEFQNISKTALLFGSTWITNSFIISAILVLIIGANLYAYFSKEQNLKKYYAALLTSLIIVYLTPLEIFNSLGFWARGIIVSMIINIPIFFAGIIFISSFRRSENKSIALGSNFIGAGVGGLLESLSFITGIKNLIIIAVFLYLLSLFYVSRDGKDKNNIR